MTRILQFERGKQKAKAEELASSYGAAFYRGGGNHAVSLSRTAGSESKRRMTAQALVQGIAETGRLLTAEEAAVYLRLSYSTLAHWRKAGKGPRVTKVGRHVRYREEDLWAFVEGK